MKGFLAAALERADAERLARLDERARAPQPTQLPPPAAWHREALVLRGKGFSQSAIGRMCGVSGAAVALMLKRKRERAPS